MAPVTPNRPMADGMLIEFFLNEEVCLTGKRLRRVEAAHGDLLACFALHLPAIDHDAADRLAADPRNDRADAAARAVRTERILELVPFFLDEPRWHGDDLQDRRVRMRLAWGLAQWVGRRCDLLGSKPYEAVHAAVWRSQKEVRRIKAEAARRDLEERELLSPALQALFREVEERRAREVILM
ncbi:hypothetical protein GCM10025783_11960 [Amnibacterium soli]|uniref:Uncharacterized protein n=1 Tax=Amnibacterium soli TaxID=1282736 RepID=A0ABP8YYR7_9MICO